MSQRISVKKILSQSVTQLTQQLSLSLDEAHIETRLILRHVLRCDQAWLITHINDELLTSDIDIFIALLQRRLTGEPIAYILGYRDFFDIRLKVTPATLIPRADTEILVETALAQIPEDASWDILDLGTGSGAIVLALAKHRLKAHFIAVDISASALAVAQENAQDMNLTHVKFIQGDWFQAIPELKFDLIVSNPPYIAESDQHLKQGDLRFEPIQALKSGKQGLDDINRIIQNAAAYLKPDGSLILEHGFNQASEVALIAKHYGASEIRHFKDLSQQYRVSSIHF